MADIRIERKRRPWWLLVLVLLVLVAIGAWLYYNETMSRPAPANQAPVSALTFPAAPLSMPG